MESNSVDSVVTDPPYELGFMNKKWDSTGVAFCKKTWAEVLRVLKPGGHLLSFSGSRTYHRMACAIEDAGFEIRDQILWVYGSGFPKSLNVGKAVDNLLGNEREVIGIDKDADRFKKYKEQDGCNRNNFNDEITKGNSKHEGWGTALKPAHEPICMARKPLAENTIAENVMAWGTGGINIDGCRVASNDGFEKAWDKPVSTNISSTAQAYSIGTKKSHVVNLSENRPVGGRFPANFIHDGSEEVLAIFPDTNLSKAGIRKPNESNLNCYGKYNAQSELIAGHEDNGGSASRFFYCAKASKNDRNEGCDGFEGKFSPTMNNGIGAKEHDPTTATKKLNHHPTVKPNDLMRYLCRLVTPTGGIILDPFMGSGSTGKAAALEGFDFIGIDLDENYCKISEARINEAIKVYELDRSHNEHHNRLRFINRNSDGVLPPDGYPNNPQPEPNSRVNFYPNKLAKKLSYQEGFRQLELF